MSLTVHMRYPEVINAINIILLFNNAIFRFFYQVERNNKIITPNQKLLSDKGVIIWIAMKKVAFILVSAW